MEYTRNGKIVVTKTRKIGSVPIEYMQDYLALHHCHAEGNIEGHKFRVNDSGEKIYITFTGLKGSLPSVSIDVNTLVEKSYEAALKADLFQKKKKKSPVL